MEYILFAVFMTSYGPTSQAALFQSQAACETARKEIEKFDTGFTREVWTACVARGQR